MIHTELKWANSAKKEGVGKGAHVALVQLKLVAAVVVWLFAELPRVLLILHRGPQGHNLILMPIQMEPDHALDLVSAPILLGGGSDFSISLSRRVSPC